MTWPWSELGLKGPADLETVRRAYAQRLKAAHPEEDPEGFQRLHKAYQAARRAARLAAAPAAPGFPRRCSPAASWPPCFGRCGSWRQGREGSSGRRRHSCF